MLCGGGRFIGNFQDRKLKAKLERWVAARWAKRDWGSRMLLQYGTSVVILFHHRQKWMPKYQHGDLQSRELRARLVNLPKFTHPERGRAEASPRFCLPPKPKDSV